MRIEQGKGEKVAKRVAVFIAFLLLLATISPAKAQEIVAQEIVAQEILSASDVDQYLQDYIDQLNVFHSSSILRARIGLDKTLLPN